MSDQMSNSQAITLPVSGLEKLDLDSIKPNTDNPRYLFDPEPLQVLKESIRIHGVLVPITVHRPEGSELYQILDGERRHRCCMLLREEGIEYKIPANIVNTPSRLAGLLAMFSIHNIREGWELMPTALGLQDVIDELKLNESDSGKFDDTRYLHEVTGLSEPQVERCLKLLKIPERFQELSLLDDPKVRVPSNFWIEAIPIVSEIELRLPDLWEHHGQFEGILDLLVEKYRKGSIKSVIHFRRVRDAFVLPQVEEPNYDSKMNEAVETLRKWITDPALETRAAFDPLITADQRVSKALDACSTFKSSIQRLKLDFTLDRDQLRDSLQDVKTYIDSLLEKLRGEDEPKDLFSDLEEE